MPDTQPIKFTKSGTIVLMNARIHLTKEVSELSFNPSAELAWEKLAELFVVKDSEKESSFQTKRRYSFEAGLKAPIEGQKISLSAKFIKVM